MRGFTEHHAPSGGPETLAARFAVEDAIARGDTTAAGDIFQTRFLEIIYHLRADALRSWLNRFISAGADTSGIAAGMLSFFVSREAEGIVRARHTFPPLINGVPLARLIVLGQMVERRLRGDTTGAMRHLRDFRAGVDVHAPAIDTNDGWGIMLSVQAGTTAMLAGDSKAALAAFTAARLHSFVPSLAFLTREATVRSALVHATFGDTREARRQLDQAEKLPRAGDWIDERTDTAATLVEALIEFTDTERARALIDGVDLHDVGEMWPYYLVALQRAYIRSGYHADLALKIGLFEELQLPRRTGNGLTGSVFAMIGATSALTAGHPGRASEQLAVADQDLVGVRLLRGVVALGAGQADAALQLTAGLAAETQGLRQFDVWRLGLRAGALLALGRDDDLHATLVEALRVPGGLRQEELRHFPAGVHGFGRERLPEWPRPEPAPRQTFIDAVSHSLVELSLRETEVLALLREGKSRADMAAHLFVSVNTVKTHLSSIYRKLGAHDSASALREAARRGLV